jgi:transposase
MDQLEAAADEAAEVVMSVGHKRGLDRGQSALLPAAVEDFVGATHMVRVIDAWAERLDLAGLGFARSRPAATGRPPYAPDDLLRLYLYGYWNRIRSSRALERECRRNVEVMFLVRQLAFDHKTIADFRKDNAAALQAACAAFVQFVRGEGLFGLDEAVLAIDGSKFKASAASGTVVDEAAAAARRERLAERIAQHLAQMDELDAAEAGTDDPQAEQLAAALKKLLDKDVALAAAQAQIQAQIDAQAQAPVPEPIKPQAGLTDPDAVALRGGLIGYNVQQAVDGASKLIVTHEVTQQGNDHRSLAPTAAAAQAALGVESLTVVADTGYMNGEQAQRCEDTGITPVVPMQQAASTRGEELYPKTAFAYDPATDSYRCPAGALLNRFKRSHTQQTDYYGTDACASCAMKARCTNGTQRTIARSWFAAAAERADQRARASTDWMRLRAATVEHPFGLLKAILAGGFLVRSLAKVRGEMALAVLVVNLRRAMNLMGIEKMIERLNTEPATAG